MQLKVIIEATCQLPGQLSDTTGQTSEVVSMNFCDPRVAAKSMKSLERAIGIEPTTFSLGS